MNIQAAKTISIQINLDLAESERLEGIAKRCGGSVEEVLEATIKDLLETGKRPFDQQWEKRLQQMIEEDRQREHQEADIPY